MRFRYKSALSIIFMALALCAFVGFSYLFYVKVISNDAVVIVDGNITINYLSGNEFALKKDASYKFSVTNNGKEDVLYYIELDNVINNNKVKYEFITSDAKNNVSDALANKIVKDKLLIEPGTTHNYEIKLDTDNEDEFRGKIVVGIESDKRETFAEIILKNNKPSDVALTKFSDASTTKEGLIKTKDELGDSYYFRGDIINNYVSFGGKIWRIVRINGDGSVKLVLDGLTDVLIKYYDSTAFNFIDTNIHNELEEWYKLNLKDLRDFIANYKFCNDLVKSDETNFYASYDRISVNYIPTDVCLGDKISLKIGILTADEVVLAGANNNENKNYYLYNEKISSSYFTMTSLKMVDGLYYPYMVNANGSINTTTPGNLLRGVRPVINIIKNIAVTGDGTKDNPYLLNTVIDNK
ncbi:MAG: hypothetical protein RSE17_02475 [Bacilli bacterium]